MYFLYVHTEATTNVWGDSIPVSISPHQRDSCVKGDIAVIRQCVVEDGINWATVVNIEVETEIEPDTDNPETMVCWSR
jgi:hypothetical protein